jgi:hypothetical protein
VQTAEARIPTDRANRYLTQLCRHASKMGQHRSRGHPPRFHHAGDTPPPVLHVDWSDTIGAIRFGEGQCILRASDDALLLRVEAVTEYALHRLQDGVAHRLETFGYREHLAVRWQPSISRPTGQPEAIPSSVAAPGRSMAVRQRSGLARNLVLAAVVAVAIAAHLGLLGATLAAAAWTKCGATAILALILLKFIVAAGVQAAGGVSAFRYGKALLTDRKQRHMPHFTTRYSQTISKAILAHRLCEHETPGAARDHSWPSLRPK